MELIGERDKHVELPIGRCNDFGNALPVLKAEEVPKNFRQKFVQQVVNFSH
jgi:hypothetical protein